MLGGTGPLFPQGYGYCPCGMVWATRYGYRESSFRVRCAKCGGWWTDSPAIHEARQRINAAREPGEE